jgi:F0F1-type ATP synthase delta subunit
MEKELGLKIIAFVQTKDKRFTSLNGRVIGFFARLNQELAKGRDVLVFSSPPISDELVNEIQKVIEKHENR